jgi:hypothetical protein
MSSYTSLALGLLVAAAVGACSSSDDTSSPSVPPFAGGLTPAPASASQPVPGATPPTGNTAASPTPDAPAAAESATPPGGTANEGSPEVGQLEPSEPAPSGEAGGDGTGTPGEEPPVTDPVPPAETDPPPVTPRTQVFLLFGQSNMWGVPAPQGEDLEINPRVEVLTMTSCGAHAVDQWVPAQPPLHGCVGQPSGGGNGPGLGPGDYFAKTLADAFPDDTILLVPNAIPGVSIDVFQPGQQAYNSTVARARMAQQRGEIRGIIFHQGETDNNQPNWPSRVKTVVDRLRSDLQIGDVPFVAGELLYGGCCQVHNTLINQLPNTITNAFVARADGFTPVTNDGFGNLHFDRNSQREFGQRYAALMLGALEP